MALVQVSTAAVCSWLPCLLCPSFRSAGCRKGVAPLFPSSKPCTQAACQCRGVRSAELSSQETGKNFKSMSLKKIIVFCFNFKKRILGYTFSRSFFTVAIVESLTLMSEQFFYSSGWVWFGLLLRQGLTM